MSLGFREVVLVFVVVLAGTSSAPGDTLLLVNGDRLTGEPAGIRDGRFVLRTAYAGEIAIDPAMIATRTAEDPPAAGGALATEIEVVGKEEEASPWTGQVELGANYSGGNTDRQGSNFGALAVRETADDRLEGRFTNVYAEEEGERSVNEQILSLRYDRKLPPRYAFGFLSFERDEFEDLDLRAVLSPGVGHVFADGEDLKAKAEIGPSALYEDLFAGDGEWEFELRLGFHAEARVLGSAKVTEDLQYFPALTDAPEYRLLSETTFEQPLSRSWFVKLSVFWFLNSDVPEDVDRQDLKVLGSLVLKF